MDALKATEQTRHGAATANLEQPACPSGAFPGSGLRHRNVNTLFISRTVSSKGIPRRGTFPYSKWPLRVVASEQLKRPRGPAVADWLGRGRSRDHPVGERGSGAGRGGPQNLEIRAGKQKVI